MPISTSQAQGLVLAYFGASAGGHLTSLAAASNLNTLSGDLAMSAGLILGRDLSNNTAFRDHITANLKLTGDARTAANAWLDGQLNAGAARGDIIATAVTFLSTLTDTTSPFFASAQAFNTTVAAAVAWSTGAGATQFGVSALRAQQGNVDVVAGSSFTLTTGTDTLIGTAGNDTFSGTDTSSTSTDQYQDTDRIVDSSTTDSDAANLTLVGAATPQVVNVEAVNAQVNSLSSVTVTASGMTGVKNLTVTRGDVVVGGSTLSGNKAVAVDGLNAGAVAQVTAGTGTTTVTVTQASVAGATVNADAASGNTTVTGAATVTASGAGAGDTVTVEAFTDSQGTTATNAAVQNAKAVSVTTNAATVSIADNTNKFTGAITVDAPGASSVTVANAVGGATVTAGVTSTADSTIAVSNIDNTGATIVTGTGVRQITTPVKEIAINLDGTTATTDAVSISGNGWITVDQDVTNNEVVDNITLSGISAAVTFDMIGAELATYTLTGTQNVTLRGDGAIFTGRTITDSTTAGTTTLTLDALGADADLSAATVDAINVAATGTSRTLTLASGANVVLAADQTTAFAVAGRTSGATINLSTADDTAASGATIDLTTGTLTASSNVSVLNIDATVGKLTLGTALTAGATTTVNVSGTKDVALGAVTARTVNAANLTGDLSIGSAASTALTTVASGSGDDSISVNQAAVYSITTGDGADSVTLGASASAASSVVTGNGDDEITVSTTAAVVIASESGNDTITVGGATSDAVLSLGDGVDKVVFAHTSAVDLSSATNFANFAMIGVEEVDITALNSTLTINSTAFAKDNTFKLTGNSATADILRVKNVSTTAGATIDASNITFTRSSGAQLAALELEGGARTDTITGSSMNDTVIGSAGGDTIDGGDGTDTFDATGLDNVKEVSTAANASSGVVINLGATAVTAGTISAAGVGVVSGDTASVGAGKVAYLYAAAASDNSSVQATLSSIENIIGSDGADYIVGSAGNNVITGGAGADYIIAGAGADTIVFNSAATTDTVIGFATTSDKLNVDGVLADGDVTLVSSAFTAFSGTATATDNAIVLRTNAAALSTADSNAAVVALFEATGGTDAAKMLLGDGNQAILLNQDNDAASGTDYDAQVFLIINTAGTITARLVGVVNATGDSAVLVVGDFV